MSPSTERVRALRERRLRQGLIRIDVYIMPQERQHLKDFIRFLEEKRREKHSGCHPRKVSRGG